MNELTFNLMYTQGRDNPAFGVPSKELTKAFGTTHSDYLGQLQQLFGYYDIHRVTNLQKHIMNTLSASPLMVRSRSACNWDPDKGVFNQATEMTPTALAIQQEFCLETDWAAAFELLMTYINSGEAQPDPALVRLVIDQIADSIGVGNRFQGVAGGLYATEDAAVGTDANQNAMWLKARNAHKGIAQTRIEAATANAADFGHLNKDSIFAAALDNGIIDGDFEAMADDLIASAKPKLRNAIATGGAYVRGRRIPVVGKCSPAMYYNAHRRYNETSEANAQNRQRLRKEEVGGVQVLFFDQIPLIPEDTFSIADDVTGKTTASLTFSLAKNEGLGSSFTNNRAVFGEGAGAGLVVQMGTDIRDAGKLLVAGDQLVSSSIQDTDLIVAATKIY